MNLLNNEEEDLVSAWFNSSGIPRPVLARRAFFQFAPGCLAVASNSEPFIENISNRLRHYQIDKGKINKKVIEAEIYYLDEPAANKKFLQGPGTVFLKRVPGRRRHKNHRVFKTDSFYHLEFDHWEGFWRPNDLLVSFCPGENKSIKLIIAETSAPAAPLSGGKALRKKGTVNWEEISDMVHMLFMRLFGVFCLHAASLIVKGKGVILTGTSGSGKTTSALALIERGATLLSDELTLVSTGNGENTTISGIILDPRLSNIDEEKIYAIDAPGTKKNNWEKVSFPLPEKTASQGLYKEVKPALILFMDLKENNPSRHIVHEVPGHEAVTALVSQVLDPSNSTRHKEIFEAIFQLVSGCSLYRLEPGRNIDQLPEFIAGLL